MGSNPIPSIVALVRIPDIRNTGIGQKLKVLLGEIQHQYLPIQIQGIIRETSTTDKRNYRIGLKALREAWIGQTGRIS